MLKGHRQKPGGSAGHQVCWYVQPNTHWPIRWRNLQSTNTEKLIEPTTGWKRTAIYFRMNETFCVYCVVYFCWSKWGREAEGQALLGSGLNSLREAALANQLFAKALHSFCSPCHYDHHDVRGLFVAGSLDHNKWNGFLTRFRFDTFPCNTPSSENIWRN